MDCRSISLLIKKCMNEMKVGAMAVEMEIAVALSGYHFI